MKYQCKATDQQLAEAWFSPDATSQIAKRYDMTASSIRERWSKLKTKGLIPQHTNRQAVRMNGFVPEPPKLKRLPYYCREDDYDVKYPKHDLLLEALRARGHDYAENGDE